MAEMAEIDGEKVVERREPLRSVPSGVDHEKDMRMHFDELSRIGRDRVFLESVRKVTTDVPSRESLRRSIEILGEMQGKLYKSLYNRYGIGVEEANKIIADKKETDAFGASADMLAILRERVAMGGDEAVKAFDNSGQFDAGVLKDLTNRAVNVQEVDELPQIPAQAPLTPAQTLTQTAQPQTEQEKIVANLLELSNQEKEASQQLANFRKSSPPEKIQALEQDRVEKRQAYKEAFAKVVRRPDREQILTMWKNAVKLELKIARETQEQEKTPSKTK
jgi:hypothetical protein